MKNQTLRIIGGKWKSRRLNFPANIAHLRPTSDRIRETLFNWLQTEIIGAQCLDVFSGSGALGLEALSRGAKSCDFIEKAYPAYIQLKKNLTLLGAENITCHCGDSFKILDKLDQSYDLIFLDPPFGKNFIPSLLEIIKSNKLLNSNGMIYFEVESGYSFQTNEFNIFKEKTAGNVTYGILKHSLS